jgi:ElaB/YqjD/DUF883 family membrane-anchored ribosome-binding protein
MKKEHEKRPEEIERDIQQTRAEMSATIDAIQSKLTPGQMMDQAIGYLRNSLPAEFGHNLSDAVRHNPVPVALIGIGIAWMAISGRQGAPRYGNAADFGNYDFSTDEEGESLGERTHEMAQRAREKASEAREGLSDAVRGTRESLHRAGAATRDSLHRMADRSQHSLERAKSSMTDLLDEQPLIVGAVGLALGAALGAALPRTEVEDELMGEQRDDLLDSATDTARGFADQAADKARDATERATNTVRHGMHDLGERTTRPMERPGVAHPEPSHAMASGVGRSGQPAASGGPAAGGGAAANSPFRNDSPAGMGTERPAGPRHDR